MVERTWETSDSDAFLLATENGLVSYYYAIKAELDGHGQHYYKEDQDNHVIEVQEQEILDILETPDRIFQKCPCLYVENGHLVPFIFRS